MISRSRIPSRFPVPDPLAVRGPSQHTKRGTGPGTGPADKAGGIVTGIPRKAAPLTEERDAAAENEGFCVSGCGEPRDPECGDMCPDHWLRWLAMGKGGN